MGRTFAMVASRLGSEGKPLSAGIPPRWNENPTPNRNPEWIWELNRHLHWVRLSRAEALGFGKSLSEQVLNEWINWIAECRLPTWDDTPESIGKAFNAPTPWRTLEAGIRMELSWSECLEALGDSPLLTPELLGRIISSFRDHGRVLAMIPPRLWPKADHNHYLTENGTPLIRKPG